jgi:hypothetical protein
MSVTKENTMMSRLQTVITMIVTAAAVLIGTATHAADATLACAGAVQVGQQLATEITVDVGTTPLGAYSVTVNYDPAVLTIASVAGGDTPEFSGSPTTNPGSFTNGTTTVSAFQTASLTRPTGVVSIARVTFNAVGPETTTVGLTVRSLFDTNANPISVTATGCMVTVTGGSTTTTSSTTTSSTTTTSLVVTNTPPTVSIDDLPDKLKRKDLESGRLLTLHLTASEPATITLDILNKRGASLRRTTLNRTTAGSFETQISLRHVRGQLTLRVTAMDAGGASTVVEQDFKAQ